LSAFFLVAGSTEPTDAECVFYVCCLVLQMMSRLQVVCVTSLTSDTDLELKAAEDLLAVRQAATADVEAVCTRLVARSLLMPHWPHQQSHAIFVSFFSQMPGHINVRGGRLATVILESTHVKDK